MPTASSPTLIALGALLAFSTLPAQEARWDSTSPLARELTALNDRLVAAYEKEDVATLRSLLAENHVHNNVFGTSLDRDTFLADIESGVLEFLRYETTEISWFIRDGLAVATGLIQAEARRDGKPVPATRFRFTRVFAREDGAWKVLLFQNTMPPPAARP